jgi:mRNA interferase MazF
VPNDSAVSRGDIFKVALNPTRGLEIKKKRPCGIASPEELNAHMGTIIVAPLTTVRHPYRFRISCKSQGKDWFVVPDQLRTVDREQFGDTVGHSASRPLPEVLEM